MADTPAMVEAGTVILSANVKEQEWGTQYNLLGRVEKHFKPIDGLVEGFVNLEADQANALVLFSFDSHIKQLMMYGEGSLLFQATATSEGVTFPPSTAILLADVDITSLQITNLGCIRYSGKGTISDDGETLTDENVSWTYSALTTGAIETPVSFGKARFTLFVENAHGQVDLDAQSLSSGAQTARNIQAALDGHAQLSGISVALTHSTTRPLARDSDDSGTILLEEGEGAGLRGVNTVTIVDDDSEPIVREISEVAGDSIRFSQSVGTGFTVAQNARIIPHELFVSDPIPDGIEAGNTINIIQTGVEKSTHRITEIRDGGRIVIGNAPGSFDHEQGAQIQVPFINMLFDEENEQLVFEANHAGERKIRIEPVQGYGEILTALKLCDGKYTPGGDSLIGMQVRLNNTVHNITDNTRQSITVSPDFPNNAEGEYRITEAVDGTVNYVLIG